MDCRDDYIMDYIKRKFADYNILTSVPAWIERERWKPQQLLQHKTEDIIIAVDIIPSGTISKYQYESIVKRLLKTKDNFRVIIFVDDDGFAKNPDIMEYCETSKIGLNIYIPSIGIETIVSIDIEPEIKRQILPQEDGWFPSVLLDAAKGLKSLCFHEIIDDFVTQISPLGNDKDETIKLTLDTIDKLLHSYTSFSGHFGHFMKLQHFEELLQYSKPKASDHVLHSFRVFLAGCPIINKFHSLFITAHEPFRMSTRENPCVEYIWFLIAIFHDIGRIQEGLEEFVSEIFGMEEEEFEIIRKDTRWQKTHYINARRILGSLGAFVINGDSGIVWDGASVDEPTGDELTAEWITIYQKERRHSVVSAFDFLSDILQKAAADKERCNRTFIVSHAAPAALSIMLHDWKVWTKLKKQNLIPIKTKLLPMAALLIYIDTWDNYKRRGPDPLTFIEAYLINSTGACVTVRWGDDRLMSQDKLGYEAYKSALSDLLFSLDIKYGMVDDELVAC